MSFIFSPQVTRPLHDLGAVGYGVSDFYKIITQDYFYVTIYIMDSEMALQRTYSDLTMIVRPEMRQYQQLDILIEFKYIKLGELKLSGKVVKQMSHSDLLAIEKIENTLKGAITQVKGYRKRLLNKYRARLKLRTFAVVGIGFEKVLWEEVP